MDITKSLIFIIFSLFIIGCSSSYKQLSESPLKTNNEFSKYLVESYHKKADYEALKMHDWNSAKLYSEKALLAAKGVLIKPQKIDYWKIKKTDVKMLQKSFDNLNKVYSYALTNNPRSLAIAISSLDCWAEQLEEGWQISDINKCKNEYLIAMHKIYNSIAKEKNDSLTKKEFSSNDSASLITKNQNGKVMQIIYFDFDKFKLNNINTQEIESFLKKNKMKIKQYLIVGHTDTKGTKKYNHELSLKRAYEVKKILITNGIIDKNIKIVAEGENSLLVKTLNEIPHPANRRVEISPLN